MFILDDDCVGKRKHLDDLNDHNWEFYWTTANVAAFLNIGYNPNKPSGYLKPPTTAPQIDPNGWMTTEPVPPDWVNGNQVRYSVSFESQTFESATGPSTPYVTLQNNKF